MENVWAFSLNSFLILFVPDAADCLLPTLCSEMLFNVPLAFFHSVHLNFSQYVLIFYIQAQPWTLRWVSKCRGMTPRWWPVEWLDAYVSDNSSDAHTHTHACTVGVVLGGTSELFLTLSFNAKSMSRPSLHLWEILDCEFVCVCLLSMKVMVTDSCPVLSVSTMNEMFMVYRTIKSQSIYETIQTSPVLY